MIVWNLSSKSKGLINTKFVLTLPLDRKSSPYNTKYKRVFHAVIQKLDKRISLYYKYTINIGSKW